MICSIPGPNIKVLNKTVEALSKVSDEVNIECLPSTMVFTTHNLTKTSYAKYSFDSSFFFHYESQSNLNEPVVCTVSTKCLLMIFKRKMDKRLESCKINFQTNDDDIHFHLRYKSGITMTHKFHLLDWESTSWNYDPDPNCNKMICKSALLLNVLSNFKAKNIQLYVDANHDNMILRNYGNEKRNFKTVHSQIKLKSEEFHSYHVPNKSRFMMPIKALKPMLTFADSMGLHLLLSLTSGGEPLIVTVEEENVSALCVISTLPLDTSDSQGSLDKTPSSAFPSLQRNANSDMNDSMDVDLAGFSEEIDRLEMSVQNEVNGAKNQKVTSNFETALELVDSAVTDSELLIAMDEPEQPMAEKEIRPEVMHLFGRNLEPTFRASQLEGGVVICENSDSDSDSD